MEAGKLKVLRKQKKLTLEELANRIGTSKQTVHRYENGIINNIPPEKIVAIAKALETTPSELMGWREEHTFPTVDAGGIIARSRLKRLPVLGDIACGKPIYAEEAHEGYVVADSRMDADFCLRAHGDSMIGARIYDGDMVFIRSQDMVDNGQIAAVIINDEATLKRVYFYPEENKLILTPENPKYAPLVYINDELNSIKILGKAVAFQSAVI